MAVNPMNNKNLSRTHSKELAKNNRGKRTQIGRASCRERV